MFSLLITIVSIALVAALAAATIYYGGQNFTSAKAKADAAAAIAQGQQILGASQLFRTAHHRWPTDIDELVSSKYLAGKPPVFASAGANTGLMQSAIAAVASTWSNVEPAIPYYWIHRIVPEKVCQRVNLAVRGDNGIYLAAVPSLTVQCFGPAGQYSVLVGLPAPEKTMAEVIPVADPVLVVDPTGGGWTVPPTVAEPVVVTPPPTTPPVVVTPPTPTPATITFQTPANAPIATVTFPSTETGKTSAPIAVQVKNTGGTAVIVGSGNINATAPFAVGSTTCPSTIEPDMSCTVNLVFSPVTAGTFSGSGYNLTVTGPSSSWTVPLSGTGTAPVPVTPDATPMTLVNVGADSVRWDVDYLGNTYFLRVAGYPYVIDKFSPTGELIKSATVAGAGGLIAVDRDFFIHLVYPGTFSSSGYLEKFDQNYAKVGSTKSLGSVGIISYIQANHSRHIGLSLRTNDGSTKRVAATRITTDYVTRDAVQTSQSYLNDNAAATQLHGMYVTPAGAMTFVNNLEGSSWTASFGGGYQPGTPFVQMPRHDSVVSPLTNNAYAYNLSNKTLYQVNTTVPGGKVVYVATGTGLFGLKIDGAGCLYYRVYNGSSYELARSTTCGF